MKEREFLLALLHQYAKSADCFRETYQYLRKRRSCPGAVKFFEGISIMDKATIAGFKHIHADFSEEMARMKKEADESKK